MITFEILNWIVGWFGLGLLSTALCIAGAVFIPFPLKHYLVSAAIACALATTIYGKGRLDEKAEWNKELAAQIKLGVDARLSAERDVAGGLSDDRHNRDNQAGSVRPVARNNVVEKGHAGNRNTGKDAQPHR